MVSGTDLVTGDKLSFRSNLPSYSCRAWRHKLCGGGVKHPQDGPTGFISLLRDAISAFPGFTTGSEIHSRYQMHVDTGIHLLCLPKSVAIKIMLATSYSNLTTLIVTVTVTENASAGTISLKTIFLYLKEPHQYPKWLPGTLKINLQVSPTILKRLRLWG